MSTREFSGGAYTRNVTNLIAGARRTAEDLDGSLVIPLPRGPGTQQQLNFASTANLKLKKETYVDPKMAA